MVVLDSIDLRTSWLTSPDKAADDLSSQLSAMQWPPLEVKHGDRDYTDAVPVTVTFDDSLGTPDQAATTVRRALIQLGYASYAQQAGQDLSDAGQAAIKAAKDTANAVAKPVQQAALFAGIALPVWLIAGGVALGVAIWIGKR